MIMNKSSQCWLEIIQTDLMQRDKKRGKTHPYQTVKSDTIGIIEYTEHNRK